MWLGYVPSITLGPLALLFGGDAILPLVSKDPAPREIPILMVFSVILQFSFFCMKKIKSRNEEFNYITNLRRSLVENVLNIYGLLFILVATFLVCTVAILHVMRVDENLEKSEVKLHSILPQNIIWVLCIMGFAVCFPFISQHALRYEIKMRWVSPVDNRPYQWKRLPFAKYIPKQTHQISLS